MVACPECRSYEIDLVERLTGDARILRCETCGHQFRRGQEAAPKGAATAVRFHPRKRYSPSEIAAHANADHYRAAIKHWTDDDDAMSPIAPTLENPYCIQPYDPALLAAGTIGASHDCTFASKHGPGEEVTATWSLKPLKPHWYAMCERHASQWTGWQSRLRPTERHIQVFHREDIPYEDWIARHGGYVLVQRNEREHMLHLSDCSHLRRENDNIVLTEKPRRWAKDRSTLEKWTQEEVGSSPLLCQSCM
jgi:hypothetical protein